jgi:hypothetical protein
MTDHADALEIAAHGAFKFVNGPAQFVGNSPAAHAFRNVARNLRCPNLAAQTNTWRSIHYGATTPCINSCRAGSGVGKDNWNVLRQSSALGKDNAAKVAAYLDVRIVVITPREADQRFEGVARNSDSGFTRIHDAPKLTVPALGQRKAAGSGKSLALCCMKLVLPVVQVLGHSIGKLAQGTRIKPLRDDLEQ